MRAHNAKIGKLRCDVCGKQYATLGCYEERPTRLEDGKGPVWWMCLKCFGKADELAAKDDRWPDARDFKMVKEALQ